MAADSDVLLWVNIQVAVVCTVRETHGRRLTFCSVLTFD